MEMGPIRAAPGKPVVREEDGAFVVKVTFRFEIRMAMGAKAARKPPLVVISIEPGGQAAEGPLRFHETHLAAVACENREPINRRNRCLGSWFNRSLLDGLTSQCWN
jgi:hypothetical protein